VEVRALLGVAAAAVLGSALVAALVEPPPTVLVALAMAASLIVWRRRRVPWVAVMLAGITLGAGRMRPPALPACHVARLSLPRRTALAGRVVASPERRGDRTVLLLEAESIGPRRRVQGVCGLVRLGVRGRGRRWRYGDRLRLDTVLRAPRNFENPGRFDYVGHLARRGVHVTAFAWNEKTIARRHDHAGGVRARLERWRARLVTRIGAAVPAPESAVLQALVVGKEDDVPDDLRQAFTRAGVVHVLSISGLHIALVAGAGFLAARWLLARSERILLAVDVDGAAAVVSLLPVGVYTVLAGAGVATVRSALMGATAALAVLLGRRADALRLLALAAIVVALVWPGAPLEIAFQLSFASVLAIVLGSRGWTFPDSRLGRIGAALVTSPCALLGTAPLTAFHFHQVSLAGAIANPVTIPIFGSLVVGPGLLGALAEPIAPGFAGLLFRGAGLVLRPGIALVRWFAAPSWAAFDVPTPDLLELGLLYGLLLGLVLRARRLGRLVAVLAFLGLLGDVAWWARVRCAGSELRVAFIDVGQGDAAVAELPGGRVMVIDAGGFPGSDFDTGDAVVSPYLRARKIVRIDALVMTHAHPDHSNGLAYLLAHHRPREFWWTGVPGEGRSWDRLWRAVIASGARVRVLADGMSTGLEDVAVLHPPLDWPESSLNDSSLTIRLTLGVTTVLATGDIETRAEERLLARRDRLRASILKVPHHGSRTSSTAAFLAAVDPAIAVISVGADNRYGLPAPEVEERYRARGTCVLRTDRCGAIMIVSDGSAPRLETSRGCGCPKRPPGSSLRPPA
jgi:competence protein ComEC